VLLGAFRNVVREGESHKKTLSQERALRVEPRGVKSNYFGEDLNRITNF